MIIMIVKTKGSDFRKILEIFQCSKLYNIQVGKDFYCIVRFFFFLLSCFVRFTGAYWLFINSPSFRFCPSQVICQGHKHSMERYRITEII